MAKVILAEDSRTQAAMIRINLESQGFQVQICRDGAEALRAAEQQPPDLVLTDLDMPEMNGVQLTAALKRSSPRTPVLVMHTAGSEAEATAALRGGAVGYVFKASLAEEITPAWQAVQNALGPSCPSTSAPGLLEAEFAWSLAVDAAAIPGIVGRLRMLLAGLGVLDENDTLRVALAVGEALRTIKSTAQPIVLRLQASPAEVACALEGDVAAARGAWEAVQGARDLNQNRGLVLVRNLMDEVNFGADGKTLTLTKRFRPA